ncbi:MAG: D-alanyl-D-alanine carboxypeptidase, partial [Alphaproteobacteria bacterium]
ESAERDGPIVVTRISTSGGQLWGVNIGRYSTRYRAEQVLLRTALSDIGALGEALRKVVQTSRGFEANFVGMTREAADLACRRLTARGVSCETFGPAG